MTDIFTTDAMLGIVEDLKIPGNSLLNRYFPTVITEESEEIHFDVNDARRRVAPFVSANAPGKVIQSAAQHAKTFKPAYVKDTRMFTPGRALKRAAGERIGGEYNMEERMQLLLAQDLEDAMRMLTRRKEVMAFEVLSTGKSTISGDQYTTQIVDFGRAAGQSIAALSGTARWGQSAAVPMTNLRTWAGICQKACGVYPRDVILDPDTAEAFVNDANVQKELSAWRVTNATMAADQSDQEGLVEIGRVRGFNIFTYSGWYVDPSNDTETTIQTSGRVVLASSLVEGIQCHGAIQDHDALQALEVFPSTWIEPNPSRRMVQLQSAPLLVPTRPNATLGVNVL